ncbi:hypothetical protein [Paenibacillus tepidiphilus]|uniref:hypothetical protein n=1 Tax=Paenibacillus tepidiphilus TaxID=2608683 RepID=UPI00123BBECD|nr:hypothetical protein [Paenibacillus tepidiphilus]
MKKRALIAASVLLVAAGSCKSVDPVTDKATKEFSVQSIQLNSSNRVAEESLKVKSAMFDLNGVKEQLSFSYVQHDGKNVVLPNSSEGYALTAIPGTAQYILEYNHSVYSLNIEEGSIDKLLLDQVDQYNLNELSQKTIEDIPLVWAERPHIDPSGEWLIYYSNRNVVQNEGGSGQLWTKHLTSQKETVVYEGAYEFIGWGRDHEVYIRDQGNLVKIDLVSAEETTIQENAALETIVAYPYLIAPQIGKIEVIHLENDKIVEIEKGVGRVEKILADPRGKLAAVKNYPDPGSFDANILIIGDLSQNQVRVIQPEEGFIIQDFSWVDSVNLLVTQIKKGSNEQQAYLVDVNLL